MKHQQATGPAGPETRVEYDDPRDVHSQIDMLFARDKEGLRQLAHALLDDLEQAYEVVGTQTARLKHIKALAGRGAAMRGVDDDE